MSFYFFIIDYENSQNHIYRIYKIYKNVFFFNFIKTIHIIFIFALKNNLYFKSYLLTFIMLKSI